MYTTADVNKPKYSQGLNYREKLKARQSKEQNQVVDVPPSSPPKIESVVDTPPSVVEQPTPDPITTSATAAVMDDDYANESRGKMRLLQGLILKHKGGPGFGAGRLKAPDEKRFIETANDVVSMLKSEVSSSRQTPIATIVPPSPPTTTATAVGDSNPLASAQAALQEAIQKAATKLAGGAITSPPAPEAVPATPPTVAEETKTVFSTKNDDLLKEILF